MAAYAAFLDPVSFVSDASQELGRGGAFVGRTGGLWFGVRVFEVGVEQGTLVFCSAQTKTNRNQRKRNGVIAPSGKESSPLLPPLPSARLSNRPRRDLAPVAVNVCPLLETAEKLFHQ